MELNEDKSQKSALNNLLITDRGKNIKDLWFIDPDCAYINHGAYGAVSKVIHEHTNIIREEVERQPAKFFYEDLRPALRHTARMLGQYVGANGDDIVFVENATTALNAILRSIVLLPGEEVLTTNHAHPAVLHTLGFICERAGARLKIANIPFPVSEMENISEPIIEMITARTSLVVVDHITSPTALIMPIQEISDECHDRNIPLLINGAHAPGQIPLDIQSINCSWYIGNCHKWLGAPKGAAFIWTAPEFQSRLRPTAISACMSEGYHASFDWPGTKDFTPILTLESVLEFRARFGEENIQTYCHDLVLKAAHYLGILWGTECGCPDKMVGNMMLVRWPQKLTAKHDEAIKLRNLFRQKYNCEVETRMFEGQMWIRISAWLYNEMDDYHRLGEAGLDILNSTS